MDIPPKSNTAISRFLIFSLKNTMPQSIESIITPMLSVGKNIALSRFPASVVFRRLQQPKKRPTRAALTIFLQVKPLVFYLFVDAKNENDTAAASKNAKKRKTDFSSA